MTHSDLLQMPVRMITVDQQIASMIDGLLYLEIKKDTLRKSAYNPDPMSMPSLKEILKLSNTLSIGDKVGVSYFYYHNETSFL